MIFFTEPPLLPDEEEARRWAEEELSRSVYKGEPESLLQRLLDWLADGFSRAEQSSGISIDILPVVIVAAIAVAVILAFVINGPVRRVRKIRNKSHKVLADDTRTAAEIRAAAAAHESAGQWSLAVLERFRAITRSLIERAILDDRPGQTAYEVVQTAAPALPGVASELSQAGALFDRVCYGEVPATADEAAWIREVDQRIVVTKPNTAAVMA